MTEREWLDSKRPFTCKNIAKDFGTARKLRLLMVGFLDQVQDSLSAEAFSVYAMLREWAEHEKSKLEDRAWSAPGGPLANYMEFTLKGRGADAVGWVVHHGSRIEPKWTYSIGMPAAELSDKVAQAVVLKNVGPSPTGVSVVDPKHRQWSEAWNNEVQAVHERLAGIMRCVYGNPFRPVSIAPAWLTPDVRSLALAIYEGRDFGCMAELANALTRAGCTNLDILNHCNQLDPHVRGCWVIDGILGKV